MEDDPLTLTCQSRNKNDAELSWRWIPFDPDYGMIDKSLEIKANQLPAGLYILLLTLHEFIVLFQQLYMYSDGLGYLQPYDEKTSKLKHPEPLDKVVKVNKLQWNAIPIVASGIYQCYDANDLDIPASNFILDVSSNMQYVVFINYK